MTEDKGQIRVVIVEDDPGLLAMLADSIRSSPAMKLLDVFDCAEEAMPRIRKNPPDVIISDIQLPGKSGVEFTAKVRKEFPDTKVLILTAFSDSALIFRALKAGAGGYLIKRQAPLELVQAVQAVWTGGAPMSASVARRVVESFHQSPMDDTNDFPSLTNREEVVLNFLSQGCTVKEIAAKISVSQSTIRFHLRNVYEKLHVSGQTQAVIKYVALGKPQS